MEQLNFIHNSEFYTIAGVYELLDKIITAVGYRLEILFSAFGIVSPLSFWFYVSFSIHSFEVLS